MSEVIWKLELPVEDYVELRMPLGAEVLYIAVQHGKPMLWFLCDPDARPTTRRFRVAGTGHPIEKDVGVYIGSFQLADGRLVFHVFDSIVEVTERPI